MGIMWRFWNPFSGHSVQETRGPQNSKHAAQRAAAAAGGHEWFEA